MRLFNLILFISFASNLFAQERWDEKMLGFGCSISGQMTTPVLAMTELLNQKRFDAIREMLNSDLPADQFLAAFVLEKLSYCRHLELSNAEIERIHAIQSSNTKVPVCGGCTYQDKIPLKRLFKPKTREIISLEAKDWFDEYYIE